MNEAENRELDTVFKDKSILLVNENLFLNHR
jgi:hypothetical protein